MLLIEREMYPLIIVLKRRTLIDFAWEDPLNEVKDEENDGTGKGGAL